MNKLLTKFESGKDVEKLIEYRTAYYSRDTELSLYTTNAPANVQLKFANPIVCKMLSGRKKLNLPQTPSFDFLAGESLMLAPHMLLDICFPDANITDPVKCLCIEVDNAKINQIVERLNDQRENLSDVLEWKFNHNQFFHIKNETMIDDVIERLSTVFYHDHSPYRDTLIDLGLSELITRILQSSAKDLLIEQSSMHCTSTGLTCAIDYISSHADQTISIEKLSSLACMSPASLYRHFRLEFGMTPTEFINDIKMKRACDMLKSIPTQSVTDVCYNLGYTNVSHFIRRFKSHIGLTPKKYQQDVLREHYAKLLESEQYRTLS
ncbi:MAG: AraC family transcriptional regulator N-terminal domain-containing protein [Spongiibacteraceae bacterium]|nr:AraC family transcriptional regulator N-terminal domain-containing protein [Spongiibacteraceae bacterium]